MAGHLLLGASALSALFGIKLLNSSQEISNNLLKEVFGIILIIPFIVSMLTIFGFSIVPLALLLFIVIMIANSICL